MASSEYSELAKKLKDSVQNLVNGAISWSPVKSEGEYNIFQGDDSSISGCSVPIFKGEGIIHCSVEECMRYMAAEENSPRIEWDPAVKGFFVLEHIDDNIRVVRTVTHAGLHGIITGREFIDLGVKFHTEEFSGLIAESIVDETKFPADKNLVRAHNYPNGLLYYKVPGEEKQTKLVILTHCDLKGMIPVSLAQKALPASMIDIYKGLAAYVKQLST